MVSQRRARLQEALRARCCTPQVIRRQTKATEDAGGTPALPGVRTGGTSALPRVILENS